MNGVRVGLSLARERLRGASALLVVALSLVVVFAVGVLERRASAQRAADDTLTIAVFGLALPVLAYLLSERVCAGQRLSRSVDAVARYGSNRRAALLGLLLASAVTMALLSALLTVVALLGARLPTDPGLYRELRSSLGIALLAGSVYALWFAAAAAFGQRGGGRKWALIFDFVFGAGSSALALPWPRAHVRNLLGGEPPVGWSQGSAWLALTVIAVLCVGLSVARAPE